MRVYPLITILWMLPCILFAQSNIGGIVNSYHKVIGIDYSTSGIRLDDITGITVGDRIMIIQMKGASVNTTTTSSSFGSISALNDAGNYELATVCSVSNDSVYLLQQIMRTYSVADKVQLIKIPKYVSANVTAPLEAALWDSTSGKGGVLAIIVSGTLTLNAPATATGKGFKGGAFYKDGGGCATNAFQNYAYDPRPGSYSFYSNVQRGGYKGESISDLVITMDGGKGACANGGGGGNNHNNGGGGGSNLAAAGKGGDNISTTGCAGQHAGIGGYALNSNSGAKIFLGGGGGAGHANNTTSSSGGGYGGGIIFIQAQTLVSNGYTISANGSAGGNTYGDGASGGGGGGTIILSIHNYTDAVSIESKGGTGGLVDDEVISGRCYGEGGGGSGGVVYFSGTIPTGSLNLSGGAKGAKINSTCASSTGAAGSAGTSVTNYEWVESVSLSGCGSIVLNATWQQFEISTRVNNVHLNWLVTAINGSHFLVDRKKQGEWQNIANIPTRNNRSSYYFLDPLLEPGTYQYRIRLMNQQNTSYSHIKQAIIRGDAPYIHYNTGTKQIFVKGKIEKNETLRIFDLSGKCIYQKKFTSPEENWMQKVSFPRSGIYIATTTNTSTKFAVVHQ